MSPLPSVTTLLRSSALAGVCIAILCGCSTMGSLQESADRAKAGDFKHLDAVDPSLNLTRDDYRHMDAPKEGQEPLKAHVERDAPPIPKLADILAAPRPPKIGETQLVSIAVTDDVPLKDVLLELAKLAGVDIELDSGITGGIEFIAKDKPFNEVIDRIAGLAGLRYTMHNNVLRVERDTPYIKSYSIDFLNLDRDSDSSVNLSTNVLSSGGGSSGGSSGGSGGGSGGSSGGGSGGGGGGGGLNTGSTSSVKSKTTGDFWKSLETGVKQILSYEAARHSSSTVLQTSEALPAAPVETVSPQSGLGDVLSKISKAKAAPSAAPGSASATAAVAPPPAPAAPAATAAVEVANSYTINRQAGLLTINGTDKQHDLIERLLAALKQNASAQVLIEAKILEVDLSDQYQSGIDWQAISTHLQAAGKFNNVGNALTGTSNVVSFSTNSARDVLSMVETFGTSRTLSSPRLHAINNQQSTLTFAKNQVYFQVTINTTTNLASTTGSSPTQTTINSQIETVPIGIMMTMMPSIDMENNEVTLSVRPTLSSLQGFVADPAVAFQAAQAGVSNIANNVPIVQVRELDSTLKLKSGQTMVIGGLMQQNSDNTDTGVPFVSGIPIIGNLFKNVNKNNSNKELVLLIKATIVDTGTSLGAVDKSLLHKFSNDPRPVSF